jgi:hypothetical protein
VEVSHPDHPAPVREHLAALAKELDLVPTAGSDFHGELIVPGRKLGSAQMERQGHLRALPEAIAFSPAASDGMCLLLVALGTGLLRSVFASDDTRVPASSA